MKVEYILHDVLQDIPSQQPNDFLVLLAIAKTALVEARKTQEYKQLLQSKNCNLSLLKATTSIIEILDSVQ